MKTEWRIYWKDNVRRSRGVALSLGVSLVFWIFNLPIFQKSEYLINLLISAVYGLTIFLYVWGAYAIAYALVTQRQISTGDKPKRFTWTIHILLSLFSTVAGLVTAKWIEVKILGQEFSTSGLLNSILIGSFIAFMFMFYYAYKHSAEENLTLKAAKIESELHVLKTQLQPHFLFNSLNSLSELIEMNKESAAEMAMNLSDLYREILENSKKKLVSLDSEVSIIRKYLNLEKTRFGNRLDYEINMPTSCSRIMLPPLILQTLVENAVKHGIAPSVNGGKVTISVWSDVKPGFYLKVTNTAAKSRNSIGSKTGIANTKARLDLLYGSQHGFALKDHGQTIEASFWFSGDEVSG